MGDPGGVLDSFFVMSHDLLCVTGTDGYFKRLNPAWERTLGYSLEYLLSHPYHDLVHPDDLPSTLAMRGEVPEVATDLNFTNRFRCADGRYRWLSWSAAADRTAGLVYATARDVTVDREADETRARLAALVESTDDAVIGKDLDGTITSWNRGAERMYGYRAEEAIGRSIRLIFPPHPLDELEIILVALRRGRTVRDDDRRRVRRDGTTVRIALTVSPVRDSLGNVVGGVAVARDVTEHYQAERFRRYVADAPDAMLITDRDGRISVANEAAARLFGYASADLVGKAVEVLVPAAARARHTGLRATYAAHPTHRRMAPGQILTGRRADGSEFPADISLAPVETADGLFVAAAVRDITERVRAEREMVAARDEALAAADLKSRFVAVVSHEIRTPMNGVIGLSGLLSQTPLSEVQARYVDGIRSSARGLLTIINDLLDFSRIEAGRLDVVPTDFDPDELVREVLAATAEAARDKPIEILTYYPPDLPVLVHGDAHRLRQILLNLTSNAVKFTAAGEIVLGVDRAGCGRDPDRYTFSVRDTGIGISPDVLTRLFEPFTQADATTSRTYGGTGLGLAISRELVQLLGGEIVVDSAPGGGSRFAFSTSLPAVPDPRTRYPECHLLAGRTVLVVEDNQTSRDLLGEQAGTWGLAVRTVASGAAASDLLAADTPAGARFDVVIVDEHLGGTDGAALVDGIARAPYPPPVLILLTSGPYVTSRSPLPERVTALAKPVSPAQLYDCLVAGLAAGPATPAAAPAHGRSDPGERGVILLAEDNEINQLVAVDSLAALGFRADVARNGVEALELIAAREYAAVLMDCQMPRMDGFQATRELRRREAGRHLPVIAMTAGALAEDRDRCLAAGMDDYLAKPIDAGQLRAVLDRWTATG